MNSAEAAIRVATIQLIPFWVSVIAAFSDVFSRMLIRDEIVYPKINHYIRYVLVGQAVFVCPLAALMGAMSDILVGRELEQWHVLIAALYLLGYILMVAYYVYLGPERFDNLVGARRYTYQLVPSLLIVAAGISQFLSLAGDGC